MNQIKFFEFYLPPNYVYNRRAPEVEITYALTDAIQVKLATPKGIWLSKNGIKLTLNTERMDTSDTNRYVMTGHLSDVQLTEYLLIFPGHYE